MYLAKHQLLLATANVVPLLLSLLLSLLLLLLLRILPAVLSARLGLGKGGLSWGSEELLAESLQVGFGKVVQQAAASHCITLVTPVSIEGQYSQHTCRHVLFVIRHVYGGSHLLRFAVQGILCRRGLLAGV